MQKSKQRTEVRTPPHLSTLYNSTKVAKLLLERGAEIEAREEENQTPLHLSAYYKITETAKLLLEPGAEIEVRNIDIRTHFTYLHFTAARKLQSCY